MRSLNKIKKKDPNKMIMDRYYRSIADNENWVFQFKEYGDDYDDGDRNIISGETYCVETGNHFHDVSSLCCVSDIEPNSITEISLSEFNRIISGN
jgi:hypothetical protein